MVSSKIKIALTKYLSKYVDNIFWKISEENKELEIIHFSSHEGLKNDSYDKGYLSNLNYNHPNQYEFISHIFSSYIYLLKDRIIEPSYGWIVLDKFSVFKYSFPMVGDPWRPKPTMPSFIMFIVGSLNKTYLDEGISLRYGWENYYHFFTDVLGQLSLLEKKGIPNSIPLIVPHFFYDISFVQEFLTLSSFIKRKIIVQKKNEFIHVKKLIVAKDTFISKSYIDVIESVEYLRDLNRDGKFFIYRSINHGRSIVNNSEIISIVKKYGFVPIDSSKLTLKEQISLFSGGCKIIGVHGAGLTNIIFRHGRSLDLLEIFPDISLTPDHYKMISKKLDFKYNSLTGKKMDSSNNFYLEPVEFESQVKGFCKIS